MIWTAKYVMWKKKLICLTNVSSEIREQYRNTNSVQKKADCDYEAIPNPINRWLDLVAVEKFFRNIVLISPSHKGEDRQNAKSMMESLKCLKET